MADRQPSTSASRMRKLRKKLRETDPNFSTKEAKRMRELRRRIRENLTEDELEAVRLKARERKRLQRAKKRMEAKTVEFNRPCPASIAKKRAEVQELVRKMNIVLAEGGSKSDSGDEASCEAVKVFYYRPNISYTCPDTSDFVYESGVKCETHYMTMDLREAFSKFKQYNPNIKIGFSKFCSLKPKDVMLVKDMKLENS